MVNLHCSQWNEWFAAAAAAVAAAAISKSYNYTEIDQKRFCCISVMKLQSNYYYERKIILPLLYCCSCICSCSYSNSCSRRNIIEDKKIALPFKLVQLKIDIIFWYTYIIYVDVNPFCYCCCCCSCSINFIKLWKYLETIFFFMI